MIPHPSDALGGDHLGGGLQRVADTRPWRWPAWPRSRRRPRPRRPEPPARRLAAGPGCPAPPGTGVLRHAPPQAACNRPPRCDRSLPRPDRAVFGHPPVGVHRELVTGCRCQCGRQSAAMTEVLVGSVDDHIDACSREVPLGHRHRLTLQLPSSPACLSPRWQLLKVDLIDTVGHFGAAALDPGADSVSSRRAGSAYPVGRVRVRIGTQARGSASWDGETAQVLGMGVGRGWSLGFRPGRSPRHPRRPLRHRGLRNRFDPRARRDSPSPAASRAAWQPRSTVHAGALRAGPAQFRPVPARLDQESSRGTSPTLPM